MTERTGGRGTGDREQGTGNREQGTVTGNRERGTGNRGRKPARCRRNAGIILSAAKDLVRECGKLAREPSAAWDEILRFAQDDTPLYCPHPCSPFPVPCPLFPVTCSLFPITCPLSPVPCSLFPVPCSLFPVPSPVPSVRVLVLQTVPHGHGKDLQVQHQRPVLDVIKIMLDAHSH